MFWFWIYVAIGWGIYYGFRSKIDAMSSNNWLFEAILAAFWPLVVGFSLLLMLRIIEVKVPK